MKDGYSMHALRQFIQQGIDAHGWRPAEFARASGLSNQLVSQLLNDDRERLASIPKDHTLDGIAQAFRVPRDYVMTYVFEAMGYSLAQARATVDLSTLTRSDLLGEIDARLARAEEVQDVHPPISHAPVSGADVKKDRPVRQVRSVSKEQLRGGREVPPLPTD